MPIMYFNCCFLSFKFFFVSFLAESFRVLRRGGRLLIVTTRSRVKGLHWDGHCNERVEDEPFAGPPAAGWWRQSPEQRRAEVVVRAAAGEEDAAARQRRSYSDILPRDNYPFRRIVCQELPDVVPQLDAKLNTRKHVFVHVATK